MNYTLKIDDWKAFDKYNYTIAFNIFYIVKCFQLTSQKLIQILKSK